MNYKLDLPVALAVSVLCTATSAINDRDSAKKKDNDKEHAFIPSPVRYIEVFMKILEDNKIKQGDRILDLGCGISSILSYLALKGFTDLCGVDNDPLLVAGMGTICRAEDGDLLDMDDELLNEISEAKIIYMYAPIADIPAYKEVVKNVVKNMSKGSMIVSLYGPTEDIFKDIKDKELCRVDLKFSYYNYYKKA